MQAHTIKNASILFYFFVFQTTFLSISMTAQKNFQHSWRIRMQRQRYDSTLQKMKKRKKERKERLKS